MHRIRLKKFVPNQPLEDNFREQQLQPDEEIIIPQDDLYTITWESDFGEQLTTRGNEPIRTNLPNGEQPSPAETNSSDAHENEENYIIAGDESNHADRAAQSSNKRLNDDVTKRNEVREATRNEESDWPNPAVYPKNQEKFSPDTDERLEKDENFPEGNPYNENDAQNSPNRGMILPCPKYRKTMLEMKV